MNTEKSVTCPICAQNFLCSTIEIHVNSCLFLNGSTSDKASESRRNKTNMGKLSASKKKKGNPVSAVRRNPFTDSSAIAIDSDSSDGQSSTSVLKKKTTSTVDNRPLAEQMRPTMLSGYVGQEHALGPQTVLFQLLDKGEVPNVILWGPPGCGKTSLANVIANICKNQSNGKLRYVNLSAAMANVHEVREAITVASNDLKFGRRTVIFMDEIHRFNKTQQDVFLPHVEAGTITLIGATTQNPSFSLTNALLSRCRVIVLEKLSATHVQSILKHAVPSLNGMVQNCTESERVAEMGPGPRFKIDVATIDWLADTCDGDARIALSGLELAVRSKVPNVEEFLKCDPVTIRLDHIKDSLKKTHMLYDRNGDQHYDMISALHKSVRASDDNAALYWLTRMILGGENPIYIARRLVRMASEDIGLADPKALGIAVHTMHGCKLLGMSDCDVLLAQCTTYLARAPKSRLIDDALRAAKKAITDCVGPQPEVPLHLRNAPTQLMKNLGYSADYNMRHKSMSGLNYLPNNLQDADFLDDRLHDSSGGSSNDHFSGQELLH